MSLPITNLLEKDQTERRLKVLIVAVAVHPDKGSEPGLGWGWIHALSKHHDLWVITGEREGNREAIARRFAENPDLRELLHIYFIPRPDGPYIEEIVPLLYYRTYRKWHEQAFALARDLHKKIGFDLAHQLNMTGFREPGYLWKLNLPFVWGPVGGTANVPLRFGSILGPREFLYHIAKVITNNLQLRFHRRVRLALSRADGFVTSTSDTRRAFLRSRGKDSVVIADSSPPVTATKSQKVRAEQEKDKLLLSWSGLHVSRKALPLVLHALSLLQDDHDCHLDIVGEGPMTQNWKSLARKLRVESRCSWHGWVKIDTAYQIVSNSDVLIFSSLHEGMPTTVMQALSVGVPVICLDHCGQGDAVTRESGMKIPVTTPKEVIEKLAYSIAYFCEHPGELQNLSVGAILRSKEFEWNKKVEKMLNVYQEALERWTSRKEYKR